MKLICFTILWLFLGLVQAQKTILIRAVVCDTCKSYTDSVRVVSSKKINLNHKSDFIIKNKNLYKSFVIDCDCRTKRVSDLSRVRNNPTNVKTKCSMDLKKALSKAKYWIAIDPIADTLFSVKFVSKIEMNGIQKNKEYSDTCFIVNWKESFTALDFRQELPKFDGYAMSLWDVFSPMELGCYSVAIMSDEKRTYLISW